MKVAFDVPDINLVAGNDHRHVRTIGASRFKGGADRLQAATLQRPDPS